MHHLFTISGVPRAGCTATASNTSSAAGSPSSLQLQQQQQRLTLHPQTTPPMQRTASLDVLYQRPSVVFVSQQQQHQQHLLAMSSAASTDVHCSATQVHKSTQTLESYLEQRNDGATVAVMCASLPALVRPEPLLAGSEPKIDKVLRQRLQRTGTSGGGITVMAVVGTQFGAGEHSVSSQTHSPHHGKCKWVLFKYKILINSKLQFISALCSQSDTGDHTYTTDSRQYPSDAQLG